MIEIINLITGATLLALAKSIYYLNAILRPINNKLLVLLLLLLLLLLKPICSDLKNYFLQNTKKSPIRKNKVFRATR